MAAWPRVREALSLYRKDITMRFTRRHALRSVPVLALGGATLVGTRFATAQQNATADATPEATPEAVSCAELVGTPVASDQGEALLDLLLNTPVKTPLFPADTGMVRAIPWIDECDTDLRDTVGGVIMETGRDRYGNPIGPGVYIVFLDADAALARLDASIAEAEEDFEGVESDVTSIELAGHPGVAIVEPDGTVTLIAVGPVIVGGLRSSPTG
jgi:hypothetical protein